MDFYQSELTYEVQTNEFKQTEALKQYCAHAVKEIKSTYGWDTEVQISILPSGQSSDEFSVTMKVFGLGEPVIAKKSGKQVMAQLRKVRKAVMRQIHRMSERKACYRRKSFFKEPLAA